MDEDGLVVDWNPRAEWMFGYTPREAIGARLSELRQRSKAYLSAALS